MLLKMCDDDMQRLDTMSFLRDIWLKVMSLRIDFAAYYSLAFLFLFYLMSVLTVALCRFSQRGVKQEERFSRLAARLYSTTLLLL